MSLHVDPAPPEISLVMPCFNEEAIIRNTVGDLFAAFERAGRRLELVAVDNGSRDHTGEILASLVKQHSGLVVVRIEVNHGYGDGLLAGLPRCTAPWIGIICADGQVEATDVVKLFEVALRGGQPRLVKVRRRFRMDGFRRKVISIAYNGITATLFGGLGSIDVNGNPKILPREWLKRMRIESRDWFLDAEIMIKAKRMGLPVLELNVLGHPRAGGASNVRASTCWEFVKNLLAYRFLGRGQTEGPPPGTKASAAAAEATEPGCRR